MNELRRVVVLLSVFIFLTTSVMAIDETELFGEKQVLEALPREAEDFMEGRTPAEPGDFGEELKDLFAYGTEAGTKVIRQAVGLCVKILGVVLLTSVLRSVGSGTSGQTVNLAGTLAVGALCVGEISGFFAVTEKTVDSMTAFATFLYMALGAATAATGAVSTATSLYGITVMVCGVAAKAVQGIFLPAVSCYVALMIADSAVEGGGLKMAADTLKQLLVGALKLCIIGFTAYLSLSGVISGSADSTAVKTAKLTISTAVPVVGSLLADASETLLVSASMLRSGIGVFGLLAVLAVSLVPFLETGIRYLMLKLTAAAAAVAGEKSLTTLIDAMAGAMGLLTAVTGVCTLMLMIGCVCFMKAAVAA